MAGVSTNQGKVARLAVYQLLPASWTALLLGVVSMGPLPVYSV